jgi:hypothetical protein
LVLFATIGGAAEAPKDVFISTSLGFSIQPPAPALTSGKTYQVALFSLPAEQGFAGNVNIQQQEFPDSIEAYNNLTVSQFKEAGITLLKLERRNGEFLYEYAGQLQGLRLHWYARAVSAPPYVYLVTATALEGSWPNQRAALVRSVESFKRP